MTRSRVCGLFAVAIALAWLPAQAADAPDVLASVRELGRAGAVRLALQRVELLQPQSTDTSPGALPPARWAEWELLRLQLLADAGRHEELLRRAANLPAKLAAGGEASLLPELHLAAARAALQLRQGAAAREHLGRAIWLAGAGEAQLRELRLLTIRSLAMDGRGADAWRSMLRFQQDYRPSDPLVAAAFVDDLLDLGMTKEAIGWLGALDERGPAKLRLRLHTGVTSPPEALAQVRAAVGRSDDPAWWRVQKEAAERQSAAAARIEAQEQLLESGFAGIDARGLWQSYAAAARAAANGHQLLAGDDAGWLEFAQRRRDAEPQLARAYFALLSRESASEPVRRTAQQQLASSLATARLQRVALELFRAWPADPAALRADARLVLGDLAESRGLHDQALAFRAGLAAPEGVPAVIWNIRLVATALRAGLQERALVLARQAVAGGAGLSPAQLDEWITVAEQAAEHGAEEVARILGERVLPQADPPRARRLLVAAARGFERHNQPQFAAEYFLRAAVRSNDADLAAEARLSAGINLLRAGMVEDAKAQFQWLLRHARNPAHVAAARRELGF